MTMEEDRRLECELFTAMEDMRAAFRGSDREKRMQAAHILHEVLNGYIAHFADPKEKAPHG